MFVFLRTKQLKNAAWSLKKKGISSFETSGLTCSKKTTSLFERLENPASTVWKLQTTQVFYFLHCDKEPGSCEDFTETRHLRETFLWILWIEFKHEYLQLLANVPCGPVVVQSLRSSVGSVKLHPIIHVQTTSLLHENCSSYFHIMKTATCARCTVFTELMKNRSKIT
jgi:hypothetical protein